MFLKMKKLITILFLVLLLPIALQAQIKKIAMLEPQGSVSPLQKAIIKAKLTEAITNSGSYEALNRTDIDQLMKEFNLQEGGMVGDDQRKRLGRLSGAELMCITQLTSDGNYFFADCSLVELESGKIIKTANQLMPNSPIELEKGCVELAAKLAGQGISASSGSSANNSGGQTYNPPAPVYTSTSDPGIVINGVKWATRNVNTPGTFANKPEGAGMFYQWNRKKAWAATGNATGWDSSTPTGTTWEKANDPSPADWRVPTLDEFKTLLDKNKVSSVWTTQNGVSGIKFTDKATGNSIFLPAAGLRNRSDGWLYLTYGDYWSSTQVGSDFADLLSFNSDGADRNSYYRSYGFTVRSVAE